MKSDSAIRRPRCSVYIATSLDGFIARRDHGLDWLAAVQQPGEDSSRSWSTGLVQMRYAVP